MEHAEILKPVAVLAGWTMLMWIWMYATRIPAINKLPKDNSEGADVGWTSAKLEGLLPGNIQWKAHNYNHLHEAPTVFYAVAITLAIVGAGDGINAQLGWAYVVLRIVHSLIQATVNKVKLRFLIFAISSFVLMALVFRAAMVIL